MSGRRGLVVPQNTFLDNIIKKTHGTHEHFLLASAQIMDSPIVYCSDGFTKMTGYKKSQVVKKKANCSFMYGSLTTKDAVRLLRNAIQEKEAAQIEILFYKRDATPFWVLLNIGLVYDELDEGVFFLLTFQDISEFKEPINPSYRKHRWAEFNRAIHTKIIPDNPISKAKEEKNRLQIAQLMEDNVRILPEYKQEIPDTPRLVILHCSTPKIIWDWFILVFILYTATSVPFIVCFKFDSVPMTVADSIVDFMFLIDIVLNFHCSYVGEDGTIIFDLKQIRRNYFRSWFFVDLVTSLPYGLLGLMISGIGKGITDFISFLKAVRLLRLNRVVRALDQYLEYGFITLILWMLFFCLCAHWMACIFYAIADHYDKFADIGWVRAMSDQTMQPLLIVNGTIVESPTLASLYMSSLYFSLTSLTSIGFGNIAPNTTAEKIFSCVTMIFGGLCYAVIFGQVTAIVQQSQKKSEGYHQTLDNMRSFCQLYNVPKEISTRIIDYYMYTWVLNRGVDTNQVLQNCPKDLQSDICIHLNRKIIDGTPAFAELSNAVLRAVARNFAIHRVAPGERVVHEGESLDALYFIGSGSFEVTQKGKVVGLLGEGDVFGDDVCRYNDTGRSVADVFALTYANVHAIGRDELLNALAFYPEYGIQFAKVFRLSYSLRDEVTMRKLSSHPRAKSYLMQNGMEGRRYSIVDELQQHACDTDSNGDLGTPNSQNMTDTDPPSKPFIKVTKPRVVSHTNVAMEGIPEDSELDRSADDDDYRRWNDHVNSRDVSEGLLNEITGMKSDVRREIEVMGGKMHQLEQNISTILRLLQEKGLNSSGSGFVTPLGGLQTATSTADAPRSRTSSIINRVKAEMPEDILPDWVEMENYGMATATKDNNNETAKPEAEGEKYEEEEVKPKRVGGRITKKRQAEARRKKKKAEKITSKQDSDEENESSKAHLDDTLDAPLPEHVEAPPEEETAEQVSNDTADDTMPLLNEPKAKKENPKQKKKKGEKSQVSLEMNDIPATSEPQIQNSETQAKPDDGSVKSEDNSLKSEESTVKPEDDSLKHEDNSLRPVDNALNPEDALLKHDDSLKPESDSLKSPEHPSRPPSSSQQEEPPQGKKKRKKKNGAKKSKREDKKDAENSEVPQVVTAPTDTNSGQPDSPRPQSSAKEPGRNEPESKEESAKLDNDEDSKKNQPAQAEEAEHPENERSISPVADNEPSPSRASTARKSSARSHKGQDDFPEENTSPEDEKFPNQETSPSGGNTPRAKSPAPGQEDKPPSRGASAKPEKKDKPLSRVTSPAPEQEDKPPSRVASPAPEQEDKSLSRVTSPAPEQEDKPLSREASAKPDEGRSVTPGRSTPGKESRQGSDVALTIDSDDDDILIKKKEKPKYVM